MLVVGHTGKTRSVDTRATKRRQQGWRSVILPLPAIRETNQHAAARPTGRHSLARAGRSSDVAPSLTCQRLRGKPCETGVKCVMYGSPVGRLDSPQVTSGAGDWAW